MTKNLFLLFSIYFFVVQAIIVGLLTGNVLFYEIGAINAGAILLISILYAVCTTSDNPKEKKHLSAPLAKEEPAKTKAEHATGATPTEKKDEPKEEKAPYKEPIAEKPTHQVQVVQPVPSAPKKRRKTWTGGQWRIFLLTLAIAIAINFTIGELFTSRSPLLSLLIGFVLYIIIGKVADLNGFYTIKKLFTVWLYYLLLALALAYGILYLYEKGDLVERYLPTLRGQENFFSNTTNQPENNDNPNINTEFTPATGDYVYEGSGEVISSTSGVNTTTETTTGTTITTGTVINTGAKTPTTGTSTNEVTPQSTPEKVKDITMIEAIKHVIDTNTLPLSKKTDISFTSMSKSNADYTYFRTAYETRMIGKNTDPSKQISCDTYMVIKGIGEGRNVGSYTDVKLAYWKKAEELGKLNGCKKGGWVTSATL